MYKVMLVEDENILRKGIEVLTDWNALNCTVVCGASNGIEALEWAKSNDVDILITDIRMPGMDGLELIQEIKKINPKLSVIILSAYGEFSYAQRALSLDVKQYVLKINYREKLPLAIKSAISEIEENGNVEINFNNLFLKTTSQSGIDDYFKSCFEKNEPYYILCIETLGKNNISDFEDFISYAYKTLKPKVSKRSDNLYSIMLSFEKGSHNRIETIKSLSTQFINSCKTLVVIQINIGISKVHYESSEFICAYKESLDNLGRILNCNSYNYDFIENKIPTALIDCTFYMKRLFDGYLASNLSEVGKINDDFFIELEKKNYDIEHSKKQAEVLFSIIGTSFQERGIKIEDFFEIVDNFNKSVKKCFSNYSLKKSMLEAILILYKAFSLYINNSISIKVNSYIENNYMYPITIEEISDFIHLSSNYIGRQYKKETGLNVLQYLNEYRVEKAKILLKEGKYQISEITFKVGYSNPAYFSNVFSKITGVSPKKYIQN